MRSYLSHAGPYQGDGETGPFAFEFAVQDEAWVEVLLEDKDGLLTTLLITTDYTVRITPHRGGSVTLVTGLASDEKLHLILNPPFTQTTAAAGSEFEAVKHNQVFGKVDALREAHHGELLRTQYSTEPGSRQSADLMTIADEWTQRPTLIALSEVTNATNLLLLVADGGGGTRQAIWNTYDRVELWIHSIKIPAGSGSLILELSNDGGSTWHAAGVQSTFFGVDSNALKALNTFVGHIDMTAPNLSGSFAPDANGWFLRMRKAAPQMIFAEWDGFFTPNSSLEGSISWGSFIDDYSAGTLREVDAFRVSVHTGGFGGAKIMMNNAKMYLWGIEGD